jgi:glucokinase
MVSHFIGVDVGATKSAAVLLDGDGRVLTRHWSEHDGAWHGRLSETVLRAVRELMTGAPVAMTDVAAVGVAVAGLVSKDGRTIAYSPMLGEKGRDLGGEVSLALGLPVVVGNDANATLMGHVGHSAPGERRDSGSGAAADAPASPRPGSRITLLLTLGTGVGGAIMVDDTIVVGEHGFAGELGHVIVDFDDGRRCACGNTGCVENYSSGRGIAELAAADPPPTGTVELLSSLAAVSPYTARDVTAAAERGDAWASGLLELAGRMLGRAIAVLSIVIDFDAVIVGGSFGHAARGWLFPAAVEEMRRRWSFAPARRLPDLAMDSIGPYAAATGAAMLAAASFEREKARA